MGNRKAAIHFVLMIKSAGCLLSFILCVTACAKKETVPVVTPPPNESSLDIPTIQNILPSIAFTIQLGAFKSVHRAEQFVQRLTEEGLDAYFYQDKSGFSKVRLGRFETRAAAENTAADLQSKGIIDDYFIVKPAGRKSPIPKADPRKALASNLVATAEKFIGIPYRWGGTTAKNGFDCSGLTMTVYRLNGLELPRKASSQYQTGKPVPRSALKKGDLVFFATNGGDYISHVGIYRGADKFIHAPGRGKYIRVSSLSGDYYQRHYRGARRYF